MNPKHWLQKYVTGTPEANDRLEAAERAVEAHYDTTGSDADAEFWRLNGLVHEAQKDVPAPRRYGWI